MRRELNCAAPSGQHLQQQHQMHPQQSQAQLQQGFTMMPGVPEMPGAPMMPGIPTMPGVPIMPGVPMMLAVPPAWFSMLPMPDRKILDRISSGSGKELCKKLKRIPCTDWAVALTNLDNEYYYNIETEVAVWDIPEELERHLVAFKHLAAFKHLGLEHLAELKPSAKKTSDENLKKFKEMLIEYSVSPYSTWDIESKKIEKDFRFSLVSDLKDKQDAYTGYCKERAKENRTKGGRDLSKEFVDSFNALLKTFVTSSAMKFEIFAKKYKNHPKFLGLTNLERETLFQEHIQRLKRKKKSNDSEKQDPNGEQENNQQHNQENNQDYKRDHNQDHNQDYKHDHKRDHKRDHNHDHNRDQHRQNTRIQTERKLRDKLKEVKVEEAREAMKVFLAERVHSDTRSVNEVKKLIKHYEKEKYLLLRDEVRVLIENHLSSLKQRALNAFSELVEQVAKIDSQWSDVKHELLNSVVASKLFGSFSSENDAKNDSKIKSKNDSNMEEEARKAFEKIQEDRLARCKKELLEALKESSFLDFRVRDVIIKSQSIFAEENKALSIDEELKLLNVPEIIDFFKEIPEYKSLEFISDLRDEIIGDYVHDLMEKYRNQKHGTLDKTIANYSNNPRISYSAMKSRY